MNRVCRGESNGNHENKNWPVGSQSERRREKMCKTKSQHALFRLPPWPDINMFCAGHISPMKHSKNHPNRKSKCNLITNTIPTEIVGNKHHTDQIKRLKERCNHKIWNLNLELSSENCNTVTGSNSTTYSCSTTSSPLSELKYYSTLPSRNKWELSSKHKILRKELFNSRQFILSFLWSTL